jgi:hypothetical protein
MNEKLHSLLSLLGPIIVALIIAIRIKDSGLSKRERSETLPTRLEQIAGVLLPLIVFGMARKTQISASLGLSFLIGFSLPIVVYVVLMVVNRLSIFNNILSNDGSANHLLLSSFGGGNRGNLLILVAFGAQISLESDVIKHFIVLDLGNLMCLLSFGFLMASRLSTTKEKELQLTDVIKRILRNPGTYAGLVLASQLPAFKDTDLARHLSTADPLLIAISPFLSLLFPFCIFLAIFLRIQRLQDVLSAARDVMTCFAFARALAALAILVVLLAFGAPTELLIATGILLFMPPSSFLWIKLSRVSPHIPAGSRRKTIYLAPNFVYFAMLLVALLFGLVSAQLSA